MSDREQELAKALKAVVVDAMLPGIDEWDKGFITGMAYKAVQKRHIFLTDPQKSHLQRLGVKYFDELKCAGKEKWVYDERKKV